MCKITQQHQQHQEPSKLVRGFTGSHLSSDLLSQAKLAVGALEEWSELLAEDILVEDKSGYGGSKTYNLTAEGVTPSAIALHSRSIRMEQSNTTGHVDQTSEERAEAAALAFSAGGVAPSRMVQGSDWYIDRWEGEQPWMGEDGRTADDVLQAAQLLAKVHCEVAVEWFEPHRQTVIDRNPIFAEASMGSHAWITACRLHWFETETAAGAVGEPGDGAALADATRVYVTTGCAPLHPIAGRVVTCHGDFHPGNYIASPTDGFKCVDLEFSHVGYATNDLAYVMGWAKPEEKRLFITGYLAAVCGMEPTRQDVDAVLFDSECAQLRVFHQAALWRCFNKTKRMSNDGFAMYRKLEALELRAHIDQALWQQIVEKGLFETDEYKAIVSEEEQRQAVQNALIHAERSREEPPVQLAGGDWLCRVDLKRPMGFSSMKQLAESMGARLPSVQELAVGMQPFDNQHKLLLPVEGEQTNEWFNVRQQKTECPGWAKMDLGNQANRDLLPAELPRFLFVAAPTAVSQDDKRAGSFTFPRMKKCLNESCKLQQNANQDYRADPSKQKDSEYCCTACRHGSDEHGRWCQGQVFRDDSEDALVCLPCEE